MQYTSSLSLFVAVQMSKDTIVNKVSSVFSNREHSPTQFNEVLRSNLIDGIREFVTRREGFSDSSYFAILNGSWKKISFNPN